MKVKLKTEVDMLENHYYENHPQKYKKMIKQIANTIQEVETIGPSKLSFDTNNIKLVGYDLWIEENDVDYIKDFLKKVVIPKQHMEKLKSAIEDAVIYYLKGYDLVDVRDLSRKEMGNIIRDVANMIAKEGKA
jgi:hypothetical protein